MEPKRQISRQQAREIGDQIGVDWNYFGLEEFRHELDYGIGDTPTTVTNAALCLAGKIALAHLKEYAGTLRLPRHRSNEFPGTYLQGETLGGQT
jgi:hypothetical protein